MVKKINEAMPDYDEQEAYPAGELTMLPGAGTERAERFGRVPLALVEDRELSLEARMFAINLLVRAADGLDRAYIAANIGVVERRIPALERELIARGWLRVTKARPGTQAVYYVASVRGVTGTE